MFEKESLQCFPEREEGEESTMYSPLIWSVGILINVKLMFTFREQLFLRNSVCYLYIQTDSLRAIRSSPLQLHSQQTSRCHFEVSPPSTGSVC